MCTLNTSQVISRFFVFKYFQCFRFHSIHILIYKKKSDLHYLLIGIFQAVKFKCVALILSEIAQYPHYGQSQDPDFNISASIATIFWFDHQKKMRCILSQLVKFQMCSLNTLQVTARFIYFFNIFTVSISIATIFGLSTQKVSSIISLLASI